MTISLWPDLSQITPPRGMKEILIEAAGDIDAQTQGRLKFFVDTLEVERRGPRSIEDMRHNCYIEVSKSNHLHLLFQVEHPLGALWPASVKTAQGERYDGCRDEDQLREAIGKVLQRDYTKMVVGHLINMAG